MMINTSEVRISCDLRPTSLNERGVKKEKEKESGYLLYISIGEPPNAESSLRTDRQERASDATTRRVKPNDQLPLLQPLQAGG